MNQNASASRLTLEDLHVGQTFESESRKIEIAEIKTFANQFDPQPFHLDEEQAKNSFFGELVASGWHVASITMRLMVECTPIEGGLIGAGGEISWLRPTRPGDTLRVTNEIINIKISRSRKDRGIVTIRSTTKNQDGKSVMIMTSRIVAPTRLAKSDSQPSN